jgi:hypothetical protein
MRGPENKIQRECFDAALPCCRVQASPVFCTSRISRNGIFKSK